MNKRPDLQKLTDDDVRALLMAPADVTDAALAERFDVAATTVNHYRRRRSYRAIRLARELGLIDPSAPRKGWNGGCNRVRETFA